MRYAALILIFLAGNLSADDSKDDNSYICVPDTVVGFAFSAATKTWERANFRVGDRKYIVRPTKEDDTNFIGRRGPFDEPYGVWKLDEDVAFLLCEEGVSKEDWLRCEVGINGKFVMNAFSKRYMVLYAGSYMVATIDFNWDDDRENLIRTDKEDEGGDTPFIEIGKCSKI